MNASRMVMWMLGVIFLLGGAYLLYFEAGLSRWVSLGVLFAGVLIFLGLAVMTFAGKSSDSTRVIRQDRDVVVDRRPERVETIERRSH